MNPAGMILSIALMFRYSLNMADAAEAIESAVKETLESGILTRDLRGNSSTSAFGDAVVTALGARYLNNPAY